VQAPVSAPFEVPRYSAQIGDPRLQVVEGDVQQPQALHLRIGRWPAVLQHLARRVCVGTRRRPLRLRGAPLLELRARLDGAQAGL